MQLHCAIAGAFWDWRGTSYEESHQHLSRRHSCSTHHRRCSLRWTRALQNSSHWCDPWRSASSEASLHSTASADCLLTWKQHLKLLCCHTAGNPRLQARSLTPYLQRRRGKSQCTPEIYPTCNHMQLSLSSERYHVISEACQNTLHVWIRNFPQVLLFLSPIRVLHWTVQPLGHHCLLQILADPGHAEYFKFFFFFKTSTAWTKSVPFSVLATTLLHAFAELW